MTARRMRMVLSRTRKVWYSNRVISTIRIPLPGYFSTNPVAVTRVLEALSSGMVKTGRPSWLVTFS